MENRNPYDARDSSPAPSKRSSIENLKRASRVKNSNMFAREQKQEYDPASTPTIERPLASGRPLNVQRHANASVAKGSEDSQNRTYENTKIPFYSPLKASTKVQNVPEPQKSPTRDQVSPNKSSLSKNSRYALAFDPENGTWSEEEESYLDRHLPAGKSLHRHAKSVTFDAAPPQVNEYEMTTPDPSSVASGSRDGSYDSGDNEEDESFDRASIDHDDSFDASLEDTDKTPVVLPEDWRFMSPAIVHNELTVNMDDPFDIERSSPAPAAKPTAIDARSSPTRTDSVNSNGERRPLPPLPGLSLPMFPRARSDSNSSLLATAERINNSQRQLASSPHAASYSKADLQNMSGSTMPIEDRIHLMMLQESEKTRSPAEEQRERRLRRGNARERSPILGEDEKIGIKIHEDEEEVENDDVADLGEYQIPPKISRESILRKVKSQPRLPQQEEYEYSSPAPTPSPERYSVSDVDPDMPLPSLEGPSTCMEIEDSVVIKEEEDAESQVDVYSIPDMYRHNLDLGFDTKGDTDHVDFAAPKSELVHQKDDDEESHYSTDSNGERHAHVESQSNSTAEDEGPPTPRPQNVEYSEQPDQGKSAAVRRMSLPQFASMLGDDDFGLSFQSYLTPSPPLADEPVKGVVGSVTTETGQAFERPTTPQKDLSAPQAPGDGEDREEEPKTPDSVIRHSFTGSASSVSPIVPEPTATIKAPNGMLKTRASLAPADVHTMAEVRRQVSGERPGVPAVPERHYHRPSIVQEEDSYSVTSTEDASPEAESAKQLKRKSSLIQLEVPMEAIDEGLSIGLDKEFDRVIEAQKVASISFFSNYIISSGRETPPGFFQDHLVLPFQQNYANISTRPQKGYLMRQNTKIVIASSASNDSAADIPSSQDTHARGTRSAGNSPRKPSQTQTWTTEPWNGKIRRKSIRHSAGSPQKKASNGPAPPMPGQQSNVTSGLDSVAENEAVTDANEAEDGTEKGRLFVKVVGVKELDLPFPRGTSLSIPTNVFFLTLL